MKKNIFAGSLGMRLLCAALALVMLLGMVPVTRVNAAQTVTVAFKNAENWSTVYGYAWDSNNTPLLGEWPGTKLTKDSTTGLYLLSTSVSGALNFIFNNGNGIQTADLSLSNAQLTAGDLYWVNGKSGTPNPYALPTVSSGKVTFTYQGTGSKVLLAGTMNNWSGVAMTKSGNTFTYTCNLEPGIYEYKFVVDGNWINDPRNPLTTGPNNNNYVSVGGGQVTKNTVTLHFQNALAWNGVCGSAWINNGFMTTPIEGWSWPGQALQKDTDGNYVMELQPELAEGQSMGYLFHDFNSHETVNLNISYATLAKGDVELWVKPTTAGADGKYSCTTATSYTASPKVEGRQVTFTYTGSATSVAVAGSFNSWSKTASKMTKSGSTFTYTTTLNEGIHQYKFVVNGSEWITDPSNSNISIPDGNSVLFIGDQTANTQQGKITVQFHINKSGTNAFNGWDAWIWNEGQDGKAHTLQTGTLGNKLVSYTVDGSCSQVGFILRKTDWSSQDDTYYVDLKTVSSGTVHVFVDYAGTVANQINDKDVVICGSVAYAKMDYESNTFWVKTTMPMDMTGVTITKANGTASGITVTAINPEGLGYSLSLSRRVTLDELGDLRIRLGGAECKIEPNDALFSSNRFASEYTYHGDDLGATWSAASTTFKVWAPTATKVSVIRYRSGNYANNDKIATTEMKRGAKGVWELTVKGDLNGQYYNYWVEFPNYGCEATDPYAKSTGANGDRGMILNMDATDPTGWNTDTSPNQGMNYTDAIIYEMHIREMTIDASSGVKSAWRGKYLGMTQTGTQYNNEPTALDHLKELGITHVQLMPTYDYNAVDEYHLTDWQQYGWGYDPKNYNVPEGSYATDPFKGEVRVKEFKQMVQTFHSNGINVIMDVVYNHAFDGGNFCYNKLVPNYFSRFWGDGSWSNGSGCGNDIATERAMTRNYIVDSIMHWVEEYHIDGFRFDLAALIDTQTINEIVSTVHAKYPNVILYGEGWGGDTALTPGYGTAHKGNAGNTPGFGYFNDDFRNAIAGDNGKSTGFASGAGGKADTIGSAFRASNSWSTNPSQTINYVACHDNYSLMDKLCLSRNGAYWDQLVKMNNLSAAIYMLAQGTPFIYSGEELLREKKNTSGDRIDNAHGTDDYVNKIRWSDFKNKTFAAVTDDYYAGLVDFRKNHAALRCPNGSDAWNHVQYRKINDHCILFYLDGYPNYECSDGIVIIYNAQESTQWVNLYDYGVPAGNWQACIHGNQAGTSALWTTSNGNVGVDGISATVLVKGDLIHEESVYNNQTSGVCRHGSHDQNGVCTGCGQTVGHSFVEGTCGICGKVDPTYVPPVKEYYLFGYINGANYGCEEDHQNMGEYLFVDGKLTATFKQDSYIAVKEGGNAVWYMSQAYIQTTSGKFYDTETGTGEKMFVPGGVELTFTLTENADGSLTLSYTTAQPDPTVTVSGSVNTGAAGITTIELMADGAVVASTKADGKTGTYTISNVPAGSYTLKVSKANHVTREYPLSVSTAAVTQDVKIHLIGDVNGDGRVNTGDVSKIYAHAKKTTLMDGYEFLCADINGDGRVNTGDTSKAYAHAKKTALLW